MDKPTHYDRRHQPVEDSRPRTVQRVTRNVDSSSDSSDEAESDGESNQRPRHQPGALFPREGVERLPQQSAAQPRQSGPASYQAGPPSPPAFAEGMIANSPRRYTAHWRTFVLKHPEVLDDAEDGHYFETEAIHCLASNKLDRAKSCIEVATVFDLYGGGSRTRHLQHIEAMIRNESEAVNRFLDKFLEIYTHCDKKRQARPSAGQERRESRSNASTHQIARTLDKTSISGTKPNRHDNSTGAISTSPIGIDLGKARTTSIESSISKSLDKGTTTIIGVKPSRHDNSSGVKNTSRMGMDTGKGRKPSIEPSTSKPAVVSWSTGTDRHQGDDRARPNLPAKTDRHGSTTAKPATTGPDIRKKELERKDPSIKGPREGAAEQERLDRRYIQREPKKAGKFFHVGRVFAILDHQEFSGKDDETTAKWVQKITTGDGIESRVYSHIRRFVVVREGHGYCWAVPVHTYKGQGCRKRGLNRDDIAAHAIIHSTPTAPDLLRGEPVMTKTPIAIELGSTADELDRASRVNFDQVRTIQHNVRAMDIGYVKQSSRPSFEAYWRQHLLR